MYREEFEILFEKYKMGFASQDEIREMFGLFKDDPTLKEMVEADLLDEWKSTKSIYKPDNAALKFINKKKVISIRKFAAIAASILVLIGAGYGMWNMKYLDTANYQTSFEETNEVTLSDGSHILLNANSKVEWKEDWEKEGVRVAKLEGEAFFDVQKYEGKNGVKARFEVHLEPMIIEVLGTSFNVDTRGEKTEIFLKEGKIRLKNLPNNQVVEMIPGDHFVFNNVSKEFVKSTNKTHHAVAAWTEGVIRYQGVELQTILNELQEIYGINLVCHDLETQKRKMDFAVPFSKWEHSRKVLSLAMNVKIEESQGIWYVTSFRIK